MSLQDYGFFISTVLRALQEALEMPIITHTNHIMKTIHTIFLTLFCFPAFAQFSDVDIRSSGPSELGWNESWTKTQMYITSEDAALWVTPQPSGFLDVSCNPKKGIPVNRNVSLQKAFDEFKSPARVGR